MGCLVKLVLCFALFFMVSGAEKVHILIQNDIRGQTIFIHCYSKGGDLGYHELTHGQSLSSNFWPILVFGITKFYCDFNSTEGTGTTLFMIVIYPADVLKIVSG